MIEPDAYFVVYILSNVVYLYTIYRFMNIFFVTIPKNKSIERLTYITGYMAISLSFLYVGIPAIIISVNLVVLLGISLNYKSGIIKRIFAVLFILLFFATVETTAIFLIGDTNTDIFTVNRYASIFGIVCIRIISYALTSVMGMFKNIRQNEHVQGLSLISIILIPSGSLYILLGIFQSEAFSREQLLTYCIMILLINFIMFYWYDRLNAMFKQRVENILEEKQSAEVKKQTALLNFSNKKLQTIYHDWKNHVFLLRSYIENNDNIKALSYIDEMIGGEKTNDSYAMIGVTDIDVLLNYKKEEAKAKKITIMCNVRIPNVIKISAVDINKILSNLIDNAIEATEKIEDEGNRKIEVAIHYDKNMIYIKITNPFADTLKLKEGLPETNKRNKHIHGIGLQNVKKAVEKHNGMMTIKQEINHQPKMFEVGVLIIDR